MLWESIFWGQGEIINWETTQAQNGCVQCLQMTNISAQVPRDLIESLGDVICSALVVDIFIIQDHVIHEL